MRFSSRTPDDLSPNPIAKALEAVPAGQLIDLTASNPTQCGFQYPENLLAGLSNLSSLRYEPQPFGALETRQAVARYLSKTGRTVDPENLILTASTSEAYSYLFKLFGDPDDAFLVPIPGYPLLDHLLHLESLELIPYSLQVKPNWPVDLEQLQEQARSNGKGLITVNPHNPTGTCLSAMEETALLNLCAQRNWVYISDEVFYDYLYEPKPQVKLDERVLSFRLGGFSKSLGLPQLKLSWIEIDGPKDLVAEAKARFELIADTYLSVNTPVQMAAEELLAFAPNIQKQIFTRVLANRKSLEQALQGLSQVKVWPAQGGWYALVEVLDSKRTDEELVLALIKEHQVSIQPGVFYDIPKGCFLVVSLLPEIGLFQTGIDRLKECLKGYLKP